MKRFVLAVATAYVLVAAANRVAEHYGMRTCDCADDCWCHRPGLSLFRWVFPWGHRSIQCAGENAELPSPAR